MQYRYKNVKARQEQIKQDIRRLSNPGIEVEDPHPAYHIPRNPPQERHDPLEVELMAEHLKKSLAGLVARVFTAAKRVGVGETNSGPIKVRWVEAYFPFTSPSWELEVWWQGEWLEMLGCGIVQQEILINASIPDRIGWASGIGIERLAMLLFGIPDIRLFWSEDQRFMNQFRDGKIKRYEAFSKYPACYKDVAFWIDWTSPTLGAAIPVAASKGSAAGAAGGDASKASPADQIPEAFHENDVMEIVRDEAGSLAEDVKLIDEFVHPSTGRKSLCYRIHYRSLERTLTNEEVNKLHGEVVARMAAELNIELR